MKKKLHKLIRDSEQVEELAAMRRRISLLGKRSTKKYERPAALQKLEKELEDLIDAFVEKAKEAKGHEVH